MTQYHCPALVDCPRADARELFDLPTASDNKCPTCQSPLVQANQAAPASTGTGGISKPVLAGAAAAVLAIAAGAWYLTQRPAAAPASTETAAPAPAPAPLAAPAGGAGIVPDVAETAALKRESETQLVNSATI